MLDTRRAFTRGLVVAALCGMIVPAAQAAEKLKVVATFSVIGDMVGVIAGDHVSLSVLIGPDGDSEMFKPALGDAKTVAEANVLFMNGLNDEFKPWLEPLLKQAGFSGSKVVVSRGAKTLTNAEEYSISGKLLPAAIDQHAWLDPRNGIAYVRNITDTLARLDPANATDYKARARVYTQELQELETPPRVLPKDRSKYACKGVEQLSVVQMMIEAEA